MSKTKEEFLSASLRIAAVQFAQRPEDTRKVPTILEQGGFNVEPVSYTHLTGIYNRQTFYRKAARLLQNNPKIPYLIVRADIDHFKVYNDVYGTEAGDKFLEKVGEICRKICPPNMIYAHYDADHFVFCFPESMPNTHLMIEQTEKEICRIQPDFDFILRFGVYRVEDPCLSVNLMCDRALLALHTICLLYTSRCV